MHQHGCRRAHRPVGVRGRRLPEGVVERRLIKTGQVGVPGRQEVLSGIRAGEQVILHRNTEATEEEAGGE